LDCVPAGWQAQPQIEPLAVDRFDLPGPGIRTGDAMAASKPGHARQRHRTPISAAKRKIAPTLAVAFHRHKAGHAAECDRLRLREPFSYAGGAKTAGAGPRLAASAMSSTGCRREAGPCVRPP